MVAGSVVVVEVVAGSERCEWEASRNWECENEEDAVKSVTS